MRQHKDMNLLVKRRVCVSGGHQQNSLYISAYLGARYASVPLKRLNRQKQAAARCASALTVAPLHDSGELGERALKVLEGEVVAAELYLCGHVVYVLDCAHFALRWMVPLHGWRR